MKKLKESKLLQSFIGFGSVIAVLWSATLFVNKIITYETVGVSWWEMATTIAVTVLLCGFIIGLSAFAKRYKMSWLYYPVFIVCFISAFSSHVSYCIESYCSFLVWGLFLVPLGMPFMDITEGLEKLLEYPVDYGGKASYMYRYDFTILFLAVIVLSLIIYQYPTKKEKNRYTKWELDHSTKLMAKIMIGVFGTYAFLSDVLLAISSDSIIYDVLSVILFPLVLILLMTFIIYVVPLALCITLIIKVGKQLHTERNPRLIFHPYIVAAVASTIAGGVRLFNVAMLGF